MNQVELLRHVADNIEAGRPAGYGLYFNGVESMIQLAGAIEFNDPELYSLTPSTVIINGIEVERGVDDEPYKNVTYWYPDFSNMLCDFRYWQGSPFDKKMLENGLVFLKEYKAIAMAKAMLDFQEV